MAEVMIAQSYTREGVQPDQLTLHADQGAPMTSKTIRADPEGAAPPT